MNAKWLPRVIVPILTVGVLMGCQFGAAVGEPARTDRVPGPEQPFVGAPAPDPAVTPTPAPAEARVGPVDQPGHVPVERGQARDQVVAPPDQPSAAPVPTPRDRRMEEQPPPPVPQPSPPPHQPEQNQQRIDPQQQVDRDRDVEQPDAQANAQPDAQPAAARDEAVPEILALAQVRAQEPTPLQVRSPAFGDEQSIPETFADYGEGISPELTWEDAPQETQSFVVLMEDPDAEEPRPFVHWIVYNLPADVTSLRPAVPALPRLGQFDGALQGLNSRGSIGYYGPRPPQGNPPHNYHFQVFALDTMLDLPPGASRDQVLQAMEGHVLRSGQTVGTFQKR